MKKMHLRTFVAILFLCTFLIGPQHCIKVLAATKFTLKNGKTVSSVLYANHKYTLRVKGQSVYFYSNRTSIASVNKYSGQLTVKEPGKVTISARKRGTSRTVCSKTFIVKRRSDYIVPSSQALSFVTGETYKLRIRKSPENSTDVIRFASTNTKVASVNPVTGLIKAKAPGSATVIAYSKATSSTSNTSKQNRSVRTSIKVYSGVSYAKQTGLSELQIGFSGTPAKLKPADFKLKNTSGRTAQVASFNLHGKIAILRLNKNLLDGTVYTLTYRTSKAKFTASDGIIRKFKITTTKIPVNTETQVIACSYDKRNMQLGEYTYGNTYSGIKFTVTSSYLTTSKKLLITSPNGTADARITYTPKGSSKVSVDSGIIKITAFDPELMAARYRCHITDSAEFVFTNKTDCNLSLPGTANNYYAHFNIMTSSTTELSDYSKFTVCSSDTDILYLPDHQLNNGEKCVNLIPIKPGEVSILLKDADNNIIYTFPVVVKAPPKLTSLTASKDELTLVNTVETSQETISLTARDQFGVTMENVFNTLVSVECTSCTSTYVTVKEVNECGFFYYTINKSEITFNGYNVSPGKYTYKISLNDVYTTITLEVFGRQPSVFPVPSPSPSETPKPTGSVTPSVSPVVTVTPKPTVSVVPSVSPVITVTPEPTESVSPSDSPVVTVTPEPTESVSPSDSPVVTVTPEPSPTPSSVE